jgi:hypothetical protein
MKKFFTAFFVFLGVIFFLILVALGFIYVTDTFGVRSLLTRSATAPAASETSKGSVDKNPLLSAPQEKTLEAIGVDPAALPSKITPEMLACFDAKLGTARTLEIKNGSAPTPTDYFKAQECVR